MEEQFSVESDEQRPQPLDEILSRAGLFGILQVLIHVSSCYVIFAVTSQVGMIFFIGHSPPWKCVDDATSGFCLENLNTTFSIDSPMFNTRCDLNRSDWSYTTESSYSFVTEYDLVCSDTRNAAVVGVTYYTFFLL